MGVRAVPRQEVRSQKSVGTCAGTESAATTTTACASLKAKRTELPLPPGYNGRVFACSL